ncbi:hypothetical protein GCM10009687_17260 [Asanoa iriomotensis]
MRAATKRTGEAKTSLRKALPRQAVIPLLLPLTLGLQDHQRAAGRRRVAPAINCGRVRPEREAREACWRTCGVDVVSGVGWPTGGRPGLADRGPARSGRPGAGPVWRARGRTGLAGPGAGPVWRARGPDRFGGPG